MVYNSIVTPTLRFPPISPPKARLKFVTDFVNLGRQPTVRCASRVRTRRGWACRPPARGNARRGATPPPPAPAAAAHGHGHGRGVAAGSGDIAPSAAAGVAAAAGPGGRDRGSAAAPARLSTEINRKCHNFQPSFGGANWREPEGQSCRPL